METVFINFKGRGIKASINKEDFDSKVHQLWTEKDEAALHAPLARKPEASEASATEVPVGKISRPAKTRNISR